MLPLGTVINERYRLDRTLGAGGMGVVYEATQLGLDRQVALKVVRGDPLDAGRAAARLVQEARALAALRSPHVAQVIDVGTHRGAPFFVMELLRGRTVHDLVAREGPATVELAADIVVQACHALGEAHRHGIVHRDVKPSNLFVAEDDAGGTVLKVIDFGVSKARPFDASSSSTETKTGELLGSPSFMSPEHVRSASDVDARTDIWSLGVILYYTLTGKKPFEADSLLDLMTLVVHQPMPSLAKERPGLPVELEAIVKRCLEKSRDARYATARDLARALAPFASPAARELAAGMPIDSSPSLRGAPAPVPSRSSARPLTDDETATASLAGTMPTITLDSTAGAAARLAPRRRLRVVIALSGVAFAAALAALGVVLVVSARSKSATDEVTRAAAAARANANANAAASTTTAATNEPGSAPAPSASIAAQPISDPIDIVATGPTTASANEASSTEAPSVPPRARTRVRPRPGPRTPESARRPASPGGARSAQPELPRTPD